jgi:aspartokinase/homoserine dehydrogenase 1
MLQQLKRGLGRSSVADAKVPSAPTVVSRKVQGAYAPSCARLAVPISSGRAQGPSRTSRRNTTVVTAAVADYAVTDSDTFSRGAHWHVHKFGGTCMATGERIRAAAQFVIDDPAENKFVIVSALGSKPGNPLKVTDLLLNMIKKASQSDAAFLLDLAALQEKHILSAKELLGEDSSEVKEFVTKLLDDIANLKVMLRAMSIGEGSGVNCTTGVETMLSCLIFI